MVSEEKVLLMSKMAMFESDEGKDAIEIDKYTQKDYVFVQVIKTWVLSTIGFILVLFLALLLCLDSLVLVFSSVSLTVLLILLLILYIVCMFLTCLLAKKRSIQRYNRAKTEMKKYNQYILELNALYEAEKTS